MNQAPKTGRKETRLRIALAIAVFLTGLVIWRLSRPVGPVEVKITYIGFTNDMRGLYAVMLVSNASDVAVSRSTKNFLVEDVATGVRVLGWDATDQRIIPVPRPAYDELEAHESRITWIPIPTNQSPWRAVLPFGPVNWKLRLMEWQAGRYRGGRLARFLPSPAVDRIEFVSDVVIPGPVPEQ